MLVKNTNNGLRFLAALGMTISGGRGNQISHVARNKYQWAYIVGEEHQQWLAALINNTYGLLPLTFALRQFTDGLLWLTFALKQNTNGLLRLTFALK